tara:strand:+ start:371 stop:922 length:552 start_codon:yes stop_codon:yes gene_type:complete
MSNDVQKLYDAVLKLGDAALEIAEALSAFKDEKLDSGVFKRPGDPKPVPKSTNSGAGEPLTAERFKKLMDDIEEPPELLVKRSYATGGVLSPSRADARVRAAQRAANAGYDYEAWSRCVREVREKMGVSARGLGDILGVTSSGVKNWETGVCFARSDTRGQLERISAHLCGTTHASWREPKCD